MEVLLTDSNTAKKGLKVSAFIKSKEPSNNDQMTKLCNSNYDKYTGVVYATKEELEVKLNKSTFINIGDHFLPVDKIESIKIEE